MFTQPFHYLLMITSLLLLHTTSKHVSKHIDLKQFTQNTSVPQFITKFDFAVGLSSITIRYGIRKETPVSTPININIGLLLEQNFTQYKQTTSCIQKQKFYKQIRKLKFNNYHLDTEIIKINQTQQQRIWFIYAYQCQQLSIGQNHINTTLLFQINMQNNGSHLGQDQKMIWPYVGLIILWFLIMLKIIKPICNTLIHMPVTVLQTILYFSYLALGLGNFYRIISLVLMQLNGGEIFIFIYLHTVIKSVIEGFTISLLVIIAWGWSVTHFNLPVKVLFIPIVVTICNILALVVWNSSGELEDSYLIYEHYTGKLMFFSRFIAYVSFAGGCFKKISESVGIHKHFMKRFLKLGSVYLLSWPIAVIVCFIFLPKYMINQIVTLTDQTFHMISNAYMCWLFAFPDSSYKKISLKNKDQQIATGFLPTYLK